MYESYMIIYDDQECAHSHFKRVGGFDTISAIANFYGERSSDYSKVDIEYEMFYKLIKNLSVEEAIKFHNLLVPEYPITLICGITKTLFDENSTEAVK